MLVGVSVMHGAFSTWRKSVLDKEDMVKTFGCSRKVARKKWPRAGEKSQTLSFGSSVHTKLAKGALNSCQM